MFILEVVVIFLTLVQYNKLEGSLKMNIEKFPSKHGLSIMIMFILGTSLMLSGGIVAKENKWISLIIASLLSVPLVYVYSKLLIIFPGKGLYEILLLVYGKVIGKVLISLYSFYFLHLSAICLRNITEYVQVANLPDTPQYVTAISIILLTFYSIHLGFNVTATWTEKVLPFIFLIIAITLLFGIPQYNYKYITPIMYDGIKPVLKSAYTSLTFPFGETVVFMVFFGFLYNAKDSCKIYIKAILISGLILTLVSIRNILLLGFPNLANVYFPSHYATSLINVFGFIQRIEILISINLLLSGFIKCTICLYAACIGISSLFNLKSINIIAIVLSILVIPSSMLIYKSTMEMFVFLDYYKYYAIPFQFGFPILTLIVALIRRKVKSSPL